MIPSDELHFLHIFYSLKQQKKSSDKLLNGKKN